ncbi:TIGR02452 family protein [Parachitinimonas caeni]|uniref:TIGR02452 family protein n=1 Tax=Parachitinimonas caeni TaxID=3031301 RepID=A0ABT7E0F3_9NEIS|nr:TIGR02452 family protein [Parachitinimonas caeni]MDK2125777.1 TIGR02452 family protein [Parachitinimonas caeni]
MSLKETAAQTLDVLAAGGFLAPDGRQISLQPALSRAVQHTRLYTPNQALALLEEPASAPSGPLSVEVTDETTQIAARRLVETEGVNDLVLLNFASARNAGGGFINGAKAQEEDLCRCSGLYSCLIEQRQYYEANRENPSALYTDHLIYSPEVPWFRARSCDQPDTVFLASVITAPAPNAGVVRRQEADRQQEIETVLRRRAGLVLAVAAANGHRTVLLGAWGCGVFQNDPAMVADAFATWLESPRFATAFDRVVFAIYSRSADETLEAFKRRFGA